MRLFKKDGDYLAFVRILAEAHERHPIRILEFCLMPNHWHFVVYPSGEGQVTAFFRWLTHTHAMRAITHRDTIGMGPLYQGRFKSLPVERDDVHLDTLLRYVVSNPLQAKLVRRAGQWRWSGLGIRLHGPAELRRLLSTWPIDEPADWEAWVDEPQPAEQVEVLREHVRRSRPYGSPGWIARTAGRIGLEWTLRPRGRPRKEAEA